MSAAPVVAVLCTPARARSAAAAVALALAGAGGARCALAGAVGGAPLAPAPGVPAASRAAAAMRAEGLPAGARGRLAWLADRRGASVRDVAGHAAALAAELHRAAAATGAPAALALPLARTQALDRVLGWHDALVVAADPAISPAVLERALASLAALERPVAAMGQPAWQGALLAACGLRAPAEAVDAVARLGLGARERRGG